MAGAGWSILIGAPGAVLQDYESYADIEFMDQLYDYGAAIIILTGLDGKAAPAQGDVVKIVWDQGLATEQLHWFGFLSQVETKQEGNVYVLRAFTLDALLYIGQTGAPRHYEGLTPHAIIQAAGTPNPLLINSQGTTVITYGTAASVPNKVDGVTPGTALTNFLTDSTTLFENMRRLCMQARYDGASYGLEWTATLEGANNSSPRFYLVKRRERAAAYTPEVFEMGEDIVNGRRGSNQFPGVDRVVVIGGGDGLSRVESAAAGAGTRELVSEDKAILADAFGTPSTSTNANNMAQRLLGIHLSTVEVVMGDTLRHASATRAGDTCTIRQTGRADASLRCMMRHYSLERRAMTMLFGRPLPIGRDHIQGVVANQHQEGTAPQVTDTVPESLQDSVQYQITDLTAPIVVGAGATAVIVNSAVHANVAGSSLTELGKAEALLCQLVLDIDAATITSAASHQHTYDRADNTTGLSSSGNADTDPHAHSISHTSTLTGGGAGVVTIAGPFQVEARLYFNSGQSVVIYQRVYPHLVGGLRYFDMHTWPFAVEDPTPPVDDFTPNRLEVTLRNDGAFPITIGGTGARATSTEFGIWRNALHRHNDI